MSAGCGHTGVLVETGEVLSFGDNRYGQLGGQRAYPGIMYNYNIAGHNSFNGQQCLVPTMVSPGLNGIHVLQIACGSSHSLFLSDRVSTCMAVSMYIITELHWKLIGAFSCTF